MPIPPNDTTCALCGESTWIELAHDDDDDELESESDMDLDLIPEQAEERGNGWRRRPEPTGSSSNGMVHEEQQQQQQPTSPDVVVPDDLVLQNCPVRHHFHWQCFLSHSEPETHCPACHHAIIPAAAAAAAAADDDEKLLATITNEGGQEADFDMRPVLIEERLFASSPHLRTHAALCAACFTGDEAAVLDILSSPAWSPAEITHLVNTADIDKHWTPLFYAAVAGRTGIVALLLHNGADPNVRDRFEHVPAEYANEEGHVEVLDMLRGARGVY
ncbi:hypothetical protein V1525DRAFT_398854 [Lipomyces kononenkoae]|uniref:Uncharacterized protein n=1 Tax=Lipomyces kononenkoae TaxID=34357 RepID=A0ACC3T8J9_LIPKO